MVITFSHGYQFHKDYRMKTLRARTITRITGMNKYWQHQFLPRATTGWTTTRQDNCLRQKDSPRAFSCEEGNDWKGKFMGDWNWGSLPDGNWCRVIDLTLSDLLPMSDGVRKLLEFSSASASKESFVGEFCGYGCS